MAFVMAMTTSVDCNRLCDETLLGFIKGIANTFLTVNYVNFCMMYSLFNLRASIDFYLYYT